jgi:tetratricopeptide (TPR) repeat protein
MNETRRHAVTLACITLISVLVFFPCVSGPFLSWDDNLHITDNPAIRSLDPGHIQQMFTQTINRIYIPLTTLSYAIEYHFFGLNPLVFHWNNFLLHMGVVYLAFFFTLRLVGDHRVAAIAALLFAIHPMHVESVAWITERKDVLYAFFYMLSLYHYVRHLDTGHQRDYRLSLVEGFLSILSKPMALSLPLILLLCDWWKRGKLDRQSLYNKIPYLVYIIPITWITYRLHTRIPFAGIGKSTLIWIWSFTFYLIKFVVPFRLSPLYALPEPVTLTHPEYLLAVGVFMACLVLILLGRRHRLILFAALFYFLSIFFLLRYDARVDLGIVADRFMYLPSLGLCVLVASWFARRKPLSSVSAKGQTLILILLTGFLAYQSYYQSQIWNNALRFWNHVIELNPNLAIAYNNRGGVREQRGSPDLAIQDFDRALSLHPSYLIALCNRGTLTYFHKNDFARAMHYFNRALAIDPGFAKAHQQQAIIFIHEQKFPEAQRAFSQAYESQPSVPILKDWLTLNTLTRDYERSIQITEQLLTHTLTKAQRKKYLSLLAALYFKTDQHQKSYAVVEKIFHKNQAQNFLILARTYYGLNMPGQAIELLHQGIRLYPDHADLYLEYGRVMQDQNKMQRALWAWEKAAALRPEDGHLIQKIQAVQGPTQGRP